MGNLYEKLFGDIGGKFKMLAKISFWVGVVLCVIVAIVLLVEAVDYGDSVSMLVGLAYLVVGPLLSWISSLGTYAIGEHLELMERMNTNVYALRKQIGGGSQQPMYTQPQYAPQQYVPQQYVPQQPVYTPQQQYTPPAGAPTSTTVSND